MKKRIIRYSLAVWVFIKRRWFLLVCILFAALMFNYSIKNADRPKTIYERIGSQLSRYNGAHRKLEAYIKAKMSDPASYQHIKTTYAIPKDPNATTAIFTTTFRGKNAFGGLVVDSVRARCDLENGRVVEVLPQ